MKNKTTYLYGAISILLWSTLATVSKLLLGEVGSYTVLCFGAAFAAITLLFVNVFTKRFSLLRGYSVKDYVTIILIGLPGTFFYYVFLYAGTDRMFASQAFIINYLWPIMSVVFACVLLGEKFTARKIVAIAISFVGVITVAGADVDNFSADTLLGMIFCILAAVSYGLFTALNQKWNYDKFVSMMISFFASFALSFIVNIVVGADVNVGAWTLAGLGWNGIFVMAVATVTWALALDSGSTAKVSNLAYLTPFVSLIWTTIFLKEPINPFSVLGLAIIVLGIFIQFGKKEDESEKF